MYYENAPLNFLFDFNSKLSTSTYVSTFIFLSFAVCTFRLTVHIYENIGLRTLFGVLYVRSANTPNESFLTSLSEQDIYQKYMIMKRVGFINMLLVLPDFLVEFEKEVKYAGKDRDSG